MTTITLFHGTNLAFEQFDQRFARAQNDYYGGGIAYLTTSEKVARGYAEARYTQYKGVRLVYKVEFTYNKLFDVDDTFSGKELQKLVNVDKNNWEQFARSAGLLNSEFLRSRNMDRLDVRGDLLDGTLELSGNQVFEGMSKGKTVQDKARDKLISLGYDSLRYNGGEQTISRNFGKHDVYIAYKASNMKILSKFW